MRLSGGRYDKFDYLCDMCTAVALVRVADIYHRKSKSIMMKKNFCLLLFCAFWVYATASAADRAATKKQSNTGISVSVSSSVDVGSKPLSPAPADEHTPAISLSTTLTAGSRISLNVTSATGSYRLDLGDGNQIEVSSGMYRGKVVGNEIKIYGQVTAVAASSCKIKGVTVNTHDLTLLNLTDNLLTEFTLPANNQLASLSLQGNRLKEMVLPATLPALSTLNIKGNKFTALPSTDMPSLAILIAGNNLFETLELQSYTHLQSIRVANCKLTQLMLPASCTELHAEKNLLNFPEDYFMAFPALQSLRLSSNKVRALNVTACPKLKELELKDNGMQRLTIDDLPSLNYVDLRTNLLSATLLDAVYQALPSVARGSVKVTGNAEAADAHGYIATDKGWKIDVVGLPKEPTGIDHPAAMCLQTVYDGYTNQLYITDASAVASIELYAESGAKLGSLKAEPVVDFSHLAKGLYLVGIRTTNGEKKMVKICR